MYGFMSVSGWVLPPSCYRWLPGSHLPLGDTQVPRQCRALLPHHGWGECPAWVVEKSKTAALGMGWELSPECPPQGRVWLSLTWSCGTAPMQEHLRSTGWGTEAPTRKETPKSKAQLRCTHVCRQLVTGSPGHKNNQLS
jgi:hypothetical protein